MQLGQKPYFSHTQREKPLSQAYAATNARLISPTSAETNSSSSCHKIASSGSLR